VIFAGEFPRTQTLFDYYFLSGTFSVSNSYFTNVFLGVGADGFLKDSSVIIGGSSSTGNVFENVDVGPFLTTSQSSIEEVSFNTSTGNYEPIFIGPWNPSIFVPSKSSTYLIHGNTLKPAGPYANAIFMQDDPTNLTIHALIYDNSIEAQDIGFDAIATYFTTGTTIMSNKFSGTGPDAIGIYAGTYAAVLGNDVTDFTANPAADLAQIVLDGSLQGLTDTSDSTVICRTPKDTVVNLGTGNTLIGCQLVAAPDASSPSVAPAISPVRPNLLIRKPHLTW